VSIFISIAAYRDTELTKTLKNAIDNAKYPNDLNFSVLTQDIPKKHPDLSFVKNINHLKINYKDAKGAGYARKLLMEQYDDEDFFFQTDAHMRFAKDWDIKMIKILERSQTIANNKKIVLSQFPAPYKVFTNNKDNFPKDDEMRWAYPSSSTVVWSGRVWAGQRKKILDMSDPVESHVILAGYVFSIGDIVKEIPYDERISFMGEELCFSVRAYTRGWQIYAPNEMLLWHFYGRRGQSKVWNQRDNIGRPNDWNQIEEFSQKIQKDVLTGIETGIYGVADQKLFKQYQKMIGINFKQFYQSLNKT
jgi:GT2 family glycosyltransferase